MQDRIEKLVSKQKEKQKKSRDNSRDKSLPSITNLDEERKKCDAYMQKIRSLEDELNKTRSQKM